MANNCRDECASSNTSTRANDISAKLLCGSIAGIIGTTLIFPFDTAKTRLQSQSSRSLDQQSGWTTFRNIIRTQGYKGLYSGLLPNLIGVTPEKAIKLAVNDLMRTYFSKPSKTNPHGFRNDQLPIQFGMMAGATAGVAQVIATNPMEIVKIHLQMEGATTKLKHEVDTTKSQFQRALQVMNTLGPRGLYKGTLATLCRDVPFSIIFFPASVYMKHTFFERPDQSFSLVSTLLSGCLAGVVAAVLVTPMDVVKTRIQYSPKAEDMRHTSMLTIYKHILKTNGVKGLFKGSFQRALIVAPLFGIATLVYEFQQHIWNSNNCPDIKH